VKSTRTRLERLERQHAPAPEALPVIIITGPDGEPASALFVGGGGIVAEPGESLDELTQRAIKQFNDRDTVVILPKKGDLG